MKNLLGMSCLVAGLAFLTHTAQSEETSELTKVIALQQAQIEVCTERSIDLTNTIKGLEESLGHAKDQIASFQARQAQLEEGQEQLGQLVQSLQQASSQLSATVEQQRASIEALQRRKIEYRIYHSGGFGWQSFREMGQISGPAGQARQVEAIQLRWKP